MVFHHRVSDSGRALVSSCWGHRLTCSSCRFGRCIKLLQELGRVPRDHSKAHTRQSVLWARERDGKVPLAEGGYGCNVKLSTPERAVHPLAVQYSVVSILLRATCTREFWLYLHCIVLGLEPPRAPMCTKDTFITPFVFTLAPHPWALEFEIMRAVLQPTRVVFIAQCWVHMLHALENSIRDMWACSAWGDNTGGLYRAEEAKSGADSTMLPEGQSWISIEGHPAFASEAAGLSIPKERPGMS